MVTAASRNSRRRGRMPWRPRNGRSMYRHEAIASATDASSTPRRSAVVNSRIAIWRAKTSSGQCHRYSEYEIRPVNTKGRALRIRPACVLAPDTGPDHQRRANGRHQRVQPGKRCLPGERGDARRDQCQAEPRERLRVPNVVPRPGRDQCEAGPQPEFPGPERRKVERSRIGVSQHPLAGEQRHDRDERPSLRRAVAAGSAARAAGRAETAGRTVPRRPATRCAGAACALRRRRSNRLRARRRCSTRKESWRTGCRRSSAGPAAAAARQPTAAQASTANSAGNSRRTRRS